MWYAVSGRNGFFNDDDSEPSMEDDGEIVGTTGDDGLMSCSMLYDDGGYTTMRCLEKICGSVFGRIAFKIHDHEAVFLRVTGLTQQAVC